MTSNYAGFFHASSVDAVINNLVKQLSNSVLWRENMQILARHASRIYEIGPGRPLRDFFRTIDVACDSITGLTAAERIFARAS